MGNFVLKLITNYNQTGDSSLHYKYLISVEEFPENHLMKCNHLPICLSLKWINGNRPSKIENLVTQTFVHLKTCLCTQLCTLKCCSCLHACHHELSNASAIVLCSNYI